MVREYPSPMALLQVEELRQRLIPQLPASPALTPQQIHALARLLDFCPVYRDFLGRYPEVCLWLCEEEVQQPFRSASYRQQWNRCRPRLQAESDWLLALQKFRRQMSLRIAYRELNGLMTFDEGLAETTCLAEFVIREVTDHLMQKHTAQWGIPWSEADQRPARFTVLGLGKLGGGELNFCSDVDLIFIYQGQGYLKKSDRMTNRNNEEFYARLCRDLAGTLQQKSAEGFLYNVDLRLRPEGDAGPVVRSLSAMESYYAAAGQTWERLALGRARVVAGDETLGSEFFESITSFRYPRRAPHSMLSEIAGVKMRIEKEVLGEQLHQHIKSGPGGIREIEFFVQALQIIYAGRNPFLQSHSTREALDQLHRYEWINRQDYLALQQAYRFLRTVENRLQMREERQTHLLPEDSEGLELLAASLGFARVEDFVDQLQRHRTAVRERYELLFGMSDREEEILEWTLFFSGRDPGPKIYPKLRRWFWGPLPPVEERLRRLLLGGSTHNLLTREHVTLFLDISARFDQVLPLLAHPMNTLERIDRFAERYGARKQFLRLSAHQPRFFQALSLLFDRSRFIHSLLLAHPEILEEIFTAGLRMGKTKTVMAEELQSLPQSNDEECARWLWLYVKAEQVRLAIVDVLENETCQTAEANLTQLADAVLAHVLDRVDPARELQVVALGKYGSGELTFGSDLDIFLLASTPTEEVGRSAIRFLKILGHSGPQGKTFDLDLRLRPFGQDGPLVTTLDALQRYHRQSARFWEKQMLLRSRILPRWKRCEGASAFSTNQAGAKEQIGRRFVEWVDEYLFSQPVGREEVWEIDRMRHLIETEKARVHPPERAFKAGPGGVLDCEFLAQMWQLRHGYRLPELRVNATRAALQSASTAGLLSAEDYQCLSGNYEFLRRVELLLRRDSAQAVQSISDNPDEHVCLAKWMNFADYQSFWNEYARRMQENRSFYRRAFDRELAGS